MEIAIQALWITLSAYIIFLISKWIYVKFLKSEIDPFFYFLSLSINDDEKCYIRISAPVNDFSIEINVLEEEKVIYSKKAVLKEGINRIYLATIPNNSSNSKVRISSNSQVIEREFIEIEA
jgi:hypothetical protein